MTAENIHSSIRRFADDTSLQVIVDDPIDTENQLNNDLQTLHLWAKTWLVTFNPAKSESMIFSRKRNKRYHPPFFLNQTELEEVTSHKYLDVVFSNDFTWHEHLDYIKSKAWTRTS